MKYFNLKKIFLILANGLLLVAYKADAITYTPQFPLPNMSSASDPGAYIAQFFVFGLFTVGFLAVGAIVVGGIMYMMGGTITRVEKAKTIIWGAITGLILLLCSYLLLYTIDPNLVNLSPHL